jgi:hypothetical protein
VLSIRYGSLFSMAPSSISIHALRACLPPLQYAKSKLENAVSAYERVTAHDRSKTAWWDTALQLMESELSDAMQDAHVAEAEAILEDSPVGGSPEEQGGVHLPFPAFRTLAGLRAGLALELERLQGSRADVLKRLIALSLTPSAQEIAENSSCGDCRKDWGATGATCRHCKLDENLKEWENLLRVLKVHGNVAAKALVRLVTRVHACCLPPCIM